MFVLHCNVVLLILGSDGSNQQYGQRSPQRAFHQQEHSYDNTVPSPSDNNAPAHPSRITPFMSFKSFVQTLSDDYSPDMYQKMYSQYHMHYLDDFSKAFFEASKNEEWFQDRYNPIRIVERENEVKAWAAKESALIKAALQSDAAAHIAGMNLDIPSKASTKTSVSGAVGEKDDSDKEGDDSDDEGEHKPADSTAAGTTSVAPAAVGSNAAYIDGHADRSIVIHAIHACCPKDLFRSVISEQLAKKDLPVPERIIISDPSWNKKNKEKFERTAWLVMPSAAQVSAAMLLLDGLTIDVPGPPDAETGDRAPLFHFTINAAVRRARTDLTVPAGISHPERVTMDTERSARLAALLDEERGVPVESRLAAILEMPEVVSALVKPTDALDLNIAYLRRVHFMAFYGAIKCNSEADMLLRASHAMRRSVPCTAAAASTESAAPVDTPAVSEAESAVAVGKKRSLSESEETDNAADTDETGEPKKVEETAEGADAVTPVKPAVTAGGFRVNLVDRRIEAMILDVKKGLELRKEFAEGTTPAFGDEVDAAQLQQMSEQAYMTCVNERCSLEKDNKARCCYGFCKKLFKDLDFLVRHLKSKHDDFARERLVALAEPFMQSRFEKEELGFRPLPPVEVEGSNDLILVRDILNKYQNSLQESRRAERRGGDSRRPDNRQSGSNRDSHGGRDGNFDHRRRGDGRDGGDRESGRGGGGVDHSQRGSDDRDRRGATGSFRAPAQDNDGFEERRKLPVFMDVDAPKVSY